jgi:hypothetical protein
MLTLLNKRAKTSMRITLLILIALLTLAAIYLYNNPDIVTQFWLWAMGLAGLIVELFKSLWHILKNLATKITSMLQPKQAEQAKTK